MDPATAMMLMQLGVEANKATYDMLTTSDEEQRIKDLEANPEMDADEADLLRLKLSAPVNKAGNTRLNRSESFLAATGASDGASLARVRDANSRQGALDQQKVSFEVAKQRQEARRLKMEELRALQAAEKAQKTESINKAIGSAETAMSAYGENKAAEKDFAKFGAKLSESGITDEADIALFTRKFKQYGSDPAKFQEALTFDTQLIEALARAEAGAPTTLTSSTPTEIVSNQDNMDFWNNQ